MFTESQEPADIQAGTQEAQAGTQQPAGGTEEAWQASAIRVLCMASLVRSHMLQAAETCTAELYEKREALFGIINNWLYKQRIALGEQVPVPDPEAPSVAGDPPNFFEPRSGVNRPRSNPVKATAGGPVNWCGVPMNHNALCDENTL